MWFQNLKELKKVTFEINNEPDFSEFEIPEEEFMSYFQEISHKIKTEDDKNFVKLITKYIWLDFEDYFWYWNKNRKLFKQFRGSNLFKGRISSSYVYRWINILDNIENKPFINEIKKNWFFTIKSEDDCFQSFSCHREIAEAFAKSKNSYWDELKPWTIWIIIKILVTDFKDKYIFDYQATNSDNDEAEVSFYFDVWDKLQIEQIIEPKISEIILDDSSLIWKSLFIEPDYVQFLKIIKNLKNFSSTFEKNDIFSKTNTGPEYQDSFIDKLIENWYITNCSPWLYKNVDFSKIRKVGEFDEVKPSYWVFYKIKNSIWMDDKLSQISYCERRPIFNTYPFINKILVDLFNSKENTYSFVETRDMLKWIWNYENRQLIDFAGSKPYYNEFKTYTDKAYFLRQVINERTFTSNFKYLDWLSWATDFLQMVKYIDIIKEEQYPSWQFDLAKSMTENIFEMLFNLLQSNDISTFYNRYDKFISLLKDFNKNDDKRLSRLYTRLYKRFSFILSILKPDRFTYYIDTNSSYRAYNSFYIDFIQKNNNYIKELEKELSNLKNDSCLEKFWFNETEMLKYVWLSLFIKKQLELKSILL